MNIKMIKFEPNNCLNKKTEEIGKNQQSMSAAFTNCINYKLDQADLVHFHYHSKSLSRSKIGQIRQLVY